MPTSAFQNNAFQSSAFQSTSVPAGIVDVDTLYFTQITPTPENYYFDVIFFKGTSAGTGDNVTLPAHSAGDLLILFLYGSLDTVPNGTVSTNYWNEHSFTLEQSNRRVTIAYKFAASSSETVGTWPGDNTLQVCSVYSGVDQNDPFGGYKYVSHNNTPYLTFGFMDDNPFEEKNATSWVVGFAGVQSSVAEPRTPRGMVNRTCFVSGNIKVGSFDTSKPAYKWDASLVKCLGTVPAATTAVIEVRAARHINPNKVWINNTVDFQWRGVPEYNSLQYTGWSNPAFAESDSDWGGIPVGDNVWQNPSFISVDDDQEASITITGNAIEQKLIGYGFGFGIPSSAKLEGIEVEVKGRYLTGYEPATGTLKLIVDRSDIGTFATEAASASFPVAYSDVPVTFSRGGLGDLWGGVTDPLGYKRSWSVEDLTNTNFGIWVDFDQKINQQRNRVQYLQSRVAYRPINTHEHSVVGPGTVIAATLPFYQYLHNPQTNASLYSSTLAFSQQNQDVSLPTKILLETLDLIQYLQDPSLQQQSVVSVDPLTLALILNQVDLRSIIRSDTVTFSQANQDANLIKNTAVPVDVRSFIQSLQDPTAKSVLITTGIAFSQQDQDVSLPITLQVSKVEFSQDNQTLVLRSTVVSDPSLFSQQLHDTKCNIVINPDTLQQVLQLNDCYPFFIRDVTKIITIVNWSEFEVTPYGLSRLIEREAQLQLLLK